MNDRKKKIEISHWKVGDADGFQDEAPVETDEEPDIADHHGVEKENMMLLKGRKEVQKKKP